MVEDSKKRGRGQRAGCSTPAAGKGRANAVAAADADAFAAFTSKYRDMLRFADADEAEAVYSMVSLTQAAHRQQGKWQQQHTSQPADVRGPVIEVPESRAVKRRPVPLAVPASSACSEGGRSDSSAKSAPGPPPHHQHWQHSMQGHPYQAGPSMLAAALGPPGGRQPGGRQPGGTAAAGQACEGAGGSGCAAGDIHPGAYGPMSGDALSMPMAAGPFFPPGCMHMPGMVGPAGPWSAGPCLPPWFMHPAAMMMGGLPMPPLPMPPAGMFSFMPMGLGPAAAAAQGPAAAAEPAAGIPVSGPLPPAGNAFKAAAGSSRLASSKGGSAGQQQQPAGSKQAPSAVAAVQPAPSTPAAATAAAAVSQLRPASQPQQHPAGSPALSLTPSAAPAADSVLPELEQFDVAGLRPWVMSHFCEDVYLLLLDVWRPDSSKVREAIWAWKLHIKAPRPAGSSPDYRAFLVSLFGLDKLTQLTAAAQEAAAAAAPRQDSTTLTKVGSSLPGAAANTAALLDGLTPQPAALGQEQQQQCAPAGKPAATAAGAEREAATPERLPAAYGAATDCEVAQVTTSNLSSEPGAALTAPGPHVMSILLPGSSAAGGSGASATSPHRARLELQQQQQLA